MLMLGRAFNSGTKVSDVMLSFPGRRSVARQEKTSFLHGPMV